jgi:hypothetical protein
MISRGAATAMLATVGSSTREPLADVAADGGGGDL